MYIFPAIDLYDKKVVRLYKGDYLKMTVYSEDPLAVAKDFERVGATNIHIVDLEGAKFGTTPNLEVVREIAKNTKLFIEVGGGINTIDDFDRVLKCGADKVSVNSGAIKNPELIKQGALKYGSQCVVLSVDVKMVEGKYTVFAKGGRENTGMEALSWIKKCVENGAGEVVVNSIDTDGVKKGFDIPLLKEICEIVNVPVIASGGAGSIEDFITLFKEIPTIDAGLAASIFHFGEVSIKDLKYRLKQEKINVR